MHLRLRVQQEVRTHAGPPNVWHRYGYPENSLMKTKAAFEPGMPKSKAARVKMVANTVVLIAPSHSTLQ